MRRTSLRKHAGFSLVEMLVVLAMLSVVSTVGIGAFISITGSYRTTEKRMDLEGVAQRALESIGEDCSLLTASRLAGTALRGVRSMEDAARYGRVPLEDDHIVLPVSYQNPLEKRVERLSVAYAIDRETAPARLVRTMQGGYGHEAPGGATETVATGVLSMRIDYFDGNVWQENWSAEQHPVQVRVSVTVFDLDRPYEQLSRSATFPIRVR